MYILYHLKKKVSHNYQKYIAPEFMYGVMGEPNEGFPETRPEKAFL
ncbi:MULTISPECIES: hypothetical protein [Galbibacter]|uniref:Uncharacterized protein n=1 Tax=Galbibacter pacificus TaxID=2996052 RepID=A0ABT6FRM3_9FLAO|nr:hypothetical protein [Galbibacter pacificus]MDG3582976.1 hypothetical protein [Galbibacter pacificus]MDG3585905.1 hypothetical protein [Galbibacter pacificus]